MSLHAPQSDPYSYHAADVQEPPRSLGGALRRIGPGLLLTASIVALNFLTDILLALADPRVRRSVMGG